MMLRSLGWLAVATMSLSAGAAIAQTGKSADADAQPQVPDEVAAQMSDTCASVGESRGISPQHYSSEEMGGDLWLTPCNAGAYQISYEAIYQAEDTAPRKLLFAQWRNGSWTGTELLFNPTFDPATGGLSDQYKDRGAGGCGGERTWEWQEGGFRLIEYRAQETCQNEAGEYPVIFEAK